MARLMEKKTKINLLAIQMGSIIGDIQANIEKTEALIESALFEKSVDILILPEVWTVGWDCQSFPLCAENIENSNSIELLKKILYNR